MCSSQRSQAFQLATTTEQVLVHLFCFLLSPFLCAGPDRILIEPKQFINLKSCLLVTVQLLNPHFFASYGKKKHKLYMLRSAKNLLDKRFFLLFCLSPYYLRFLDMFFQIKNLRFLSSFMVLVQRNAVLESRPS